MAINIDEILKNAGQEVDTPIVETLDPVVNETVNETVSEPVAEKKSEQEINSSLSPEKTKIKSEEIKDVFPSDKFEGKFNSWDEVKNALDAPKFKDDFIKKVVETYETTGSLESFFKAYSTDWKSMNDNDVLKRAFVESHSDIDDGDVIEYLWSKELSKYGDPELLTSADEDLSEAEKKEKKSALALMARDAKKIRDQKVVEQESYLQPKVEKAPEIDYNQLREKVQSVPEVQKLLSNKKLTYKIGDSEFNTEVTDPNWIVDTLTDERKFVESFVKDGKLDVDGWIDIVNYRMNGDKMRQALVDYGKTLGRQEIIDNDYKNSTFDKKPSPGSEAEDFKVGLAKAFSKAKV